MIDGTLLVDGLPAADQLTKQELLATLRDGVKATVASELAGTDWTVENCPWFEYWFGYYESRSARDVEAALRKYAPEAAEARRAADYIDPVLARVQGAVRHWRATGEVDAPPATMPTNIEVLASLGPGRPLDEGVRVRMESALGTDLGGTRVHTDSIGAREAQRHGARAFAIGNHVAFAPGELAPGNIAGDALLAHELAHTVQQRGARRDGGSSDAGAERAADRASIRGLARLWGRGRAPAVAAEMTSGAQAGGLRLQRCAVAAPAAIEGAELLTAAEVAGGAGAGAGAGAGGSWLWGLLGGGGLFGLSTVLSSDTPTTTTTTTDTTTTTETTEDADTKRRNDCYATYLADTADCGSRYTHDQIYDKCMDHAWQNYLRCINGAKRIPFPGL